jgi:hypothetical protein
MKCVLKDLTVNEHNNIRDQRYADSFVNCPLFNGRQICYWCCLHIHDIAEPLMRVDRSILHPEYAEINEEANRDWDEIWSICSKCSSK